MGSHWFFKMTRGEHWELVLHWALGIWTLGIPSLFLIRASKFVDCCFFLLPIPYLPIAQLLRYTVWLVVRGVALWLRVAAMDSKLFIGVRAQ